jgi:peptidoglycan-associated lipoprotein
MKKVPLGAVILLIFVISFSVGCAKKKFTVGSGEGAPGGEGSAISSKEEGVDARGKDVRLRDLESGRAGRGGAELPFEAKAFEEEMIFFEFDRYDLSPQARAILEKKAAWLRSHPEYRLRIEGHCDERGTNEYNLALGDRRANAAKNYLVSLGVEPERISTISYGEERPLDPRHTEDAYSKNRRAEFKLIR